LDVLLIYPPYERLMGLTAESFPVSLGYIGTILKDNGYSVAIHNAELSKGPEEFKYSPHGRANAFGNYKRNLKDENHAVWQDIRSVISGLKPKIVGITSYSPTHMATLKIAEAAKRLNDTFVVIGGPYPTLLPKEACDSDYVDYVISGEGEWSMLELTEFLIRKKGDLNQIKGLTFKSEGKCISNPPRERIVDLDALPFVDFDLLIGLDSQNISAISTIMASRGCPHRCAFCASVPLWGRKVMYRSTESIIAELERNLKKYKIKSFRFFDDTFTSNTRKTIEFCEEFVKRKLHKKLSWNCLSRVNSVTEELIKALEKANCGSLALGVESGSERILKTLKKDITKPMVRDKVLLVKKSKLMLHLYFMIGSPYETEEDILDTYAFIKELSPESMNLCTYTPYYGTELYDVCVSKGIIPSEHDISMYLEVGQHNKYNYFCPEIPQERYLELVDMMLELSDRIRGKMTKKKLIGRLRTYKYYLLHPGQGIKRAKQKFIGMRAK
jgi:pyruvate-formate lyase-activating enzyme